MKDSEYSLFISASYVEKKTTVKGNVYYVFRTDCDSTIYVKQNDYNSKLMSDVDPDELFKLKVDAVAYNGSSFLGYRILGRYFI